MDIKHRIAYIAAWVAVAVSGVATGFVTAVEAVEAPAVEASIIADVSRGGSEFVVDLIGMNLPADNDFVSISVMLDEVPIQLSPFGGSLDVRCPAITDPDDARVTNRCNFFASLVRDAGDYRVLVSVSHDPVRGEYETSARLDVGIPAWWADFTLLRRTSDLFTGATELAVQFSAVPAVVADVELTVGFDNDGDSVPETFAAIVDCSANGTGGFICDTNGQGIPPRCVSDPISGQFCDVDPFYAVLINGINVPGLSYDATLNRLSRYEEGVFFGNLDGRAGRPIAGGIDLDTFIRSDPETCFVSNDAECFELGYYATWIQQFLGSLAATMATEGRFDVSVTPERTIAVDALVPRLPIGANGYRALITVRSVTDGAIVAERDLGCSAAACTPVSLTGLAAGDYDVSLTIFDDHPIVEFFDGTIIGQSVVASIPYGPVTIPDVRRVASMSGFLLDGFFPRSTNRVALSFGLSNSATDLAHGWLGLHVTGASKLTMVSTRVDRLTTIPGAVQASGRGKLLSGTSVRWQLTAVDGGLAGVGGDIYRIEVWRSDSTGRRTVLFDSQPGAVEHALPTATPDLGSLRISLR